MIVCEFFASESDSIGEFCRAQELQIEMLIAEKDVVVCLLTKIE